MKVFQNETFTIIKYKELYHVFFTWEYSHALFIDHSIYSCYWFMFKQYLKNLI